MLFTNIFHYLYTYAGLWIKISILCILLVTIYVIYNYQPNNDYYIQHKFYTKVCVVVYISFFIIFILVLRYYTWGVSRDIHVIINKLILYWNTNHLVSLIFFCSLVLLILILYRLKAYLTKQLIKQYLYTCYKPYGIYLDSNIKRWWHRPWRLYEFYSPRYLIIDPITLRLNQFYLKLQDRSYLKSPLYYILEYNEILFTILPISIIPCLFFYDYYMYNGIITMIFYYLPFYFIYVLWRNSHSFLIGTYSGLNRIIYERYYLDDVIVYINTTPKEEAIFTKYLNSGLVTYAFTIAPLLDFCYKFMYNRRFIRISDTILRNNNSGKIVDTTITKIKIVSLSKRKKQNSNE